MLEFLAVVFRIPLDSETVVDFSVCLCLVYSASPRLDNGLSLKGTSSGQLYKIFPLLQL